MVKQYSITINAPIDTVFSSMVNKENMDKWMDGQFQTELLGKTDAELLVGDKFHHKFGPVFELDGEVIACRKPFELGLGLTSGKLRGTLFYRLESIDAKTTKLTAELDVFDGTILHKTMFRTLYPLANGLITNILESIKQLAEAQPTN